MTGKLPREVDWPALEGALSRRPSAPPVPRPAIAGRLLLAAQTLPKEGSAPEVARAILECLQDALPIDRVGLFVFSPSGRWLQGLVGTDAEGSLADERGVRFQFHEAYAHLHERLEDGTSAYQSFDDAPLVVHERESSRVLGRGWLVQTPVRSKRRRIGVLYNDSAFKKLSFSAEMQEYIALMMALCGDALDEALQRSPAESRRGVSAEVGDALELLEGNPKYSNAELAEKVGMTSHRLSRLFSKEVGTSLVEHRNQVRLERFFQLVEERESSRTPLVLLELALAAGFGSYAQFHRVFSDTLGKSPKRYLSPPSPEVAQK